MNVVHILKQLRVFKKLTQSNLDALQTWRNAVLNYGVKEYTEKFSSSEDEQWKSNRVERNKGMLQIGFRKRLGLTKSKTIVDDKSREGIKIVNRDTSE